jgi:antitoxin MazE6
MICEIYCISFSNSSISFPHDEIDYNESDGYTKSMKTAISVPDDLFEEAERLARRKKVSRSEIYRLALEDYVARHDADRVTEAMNRVCAEVPQSPDDFVSRASYRLLKRVEW